MLKLLRKDGGVKEAREQDQRGEGRNQKGQQPIYEDRATGFMKDASELESFGFHSIQMRGVKWQQQAIRKSSTQALQPKAV